MNLWRNTVLRHPMLARWLPQQRDEVVQGITHVWAWVQAPVVFEHRGRRRPRRWLEVPGVPRIREPE